MVSIDEFSRLVAGIYAAAVTPEDWGAALGAIRGCTGGTHSGLFVPDGVSRSIIGATVPDGAGKSYIDYYYRLDYVLAALERGPVGAVRTGSELMDPHTGREFHADWLRRIDVNDGLFVRLTDGPRPTCFVLAALRATESFDTCERVKLVSGLVPHLQQALKAQTKLTAAVRRSADIRDALDVIQHGVISVGPQCTVIHLNSAAEELLRAGDGLHTSSGRVGATDPHVDRELHRALHAALFGGRSGIRGADSLLCKRPSGKRPFLIHVVPLHPLGVGENPRAPSALIMIKDPERVTESATTLMRRLYGLTSGEAEVAVRLTAGTSLRDIASELSVSYQTVRTHLQHVFDKTDTHRQGELIRLLLALSP
jgi:DNA-binding CsgD family transcriptional regulator/PAS domain-containing protein